MLITIPSVLDKATVASFRQQLDAATWIDGRDSAGSLSAKVKNNHQLSEQSEVARKLGNHLLTILGHHPLFFSAALPDRIYPPRFNRHGPGEYYGTHVDGSIMAMADGRLLRSDLSATVFLSEPDEYEGGALTIETAFGAQPVKLAAGDMVLYPSSSLHQVAPVTKGLRCCSFFWIQSMVADEAERTLLFDLDQTIQQLTSTASASQQAQLVQLSGVYHNLLRRWAKV